MILPYVENPYRPQRRRTREVRVGDVGIGAANPIRVQSMTTTDTLDTRATADQIERLVAAGCEIVRLTAPSLRDAENLRAIRAELSRRRVRVPLVADIHFTPNAALIAAEHVEKVRINPGNYADKKRFEVREYSDAQYAEELERVAERFLPLVRRCRELGRAMRIGTNHGSLSDRILNRFGDTPLGMVESALEFLDVCESEGYRDVVFSMKASNAQVAIQAYRLLAARLAARARGEGAPGAPHDRSSAAAGASAAPGYPFHLGVTEAGDGEDGRIKSAIGIGALLEDGIGDTIRVSLTEDPVKEIPVAQTLARLYDARWLGARVETDARWLGARVEPDARWLGARVEPDAAAELGVAPSPIDPGAPFVDDPYAHARRETVAVTVGGLEIGGRNPVRVELELGAVPHAPAAVASLHARALAERGDVACEGLLVDAEAAADVARAAALGVALRREGVAAPLSLRLPAGLAVAAEPGFGRLVVPVSAALSREELCLAAAAGERVSSALEWELRAEPEEVAALVDRCLEVSPPPARLLFSLRSSRPVHAARVLCARLRGRGAAQTPIVLRHRVGAPVQPEAALLAAAVELGAPLCDGIGDAVALAGFGDAGRTLAIGYRILQGARLRTSWTEFISCPSCGRTLFDLEETTARIKARTQHLKGVKIAIMGCIVNGPGEMADADFGYVGSGPGRVNLYVGKDLVERHVAQDEADDRLVELIRKHGRWLDPG